jgi:hypothetical protein
MGEIPPKDDARGGVLIPRGATLRIPSGGLVLSVSEEGRLSAELKELHLKQDTCVDWLEVALGHLREAERSHHGLMTAQDRGEGVADFMRREFLAAMQACVAAATFFEALYAATRECLPQSRNAPRPGGRRRRARSANVAEQLRRAFGLKTKGAASLREALSEVYRFRDEAVHPPAAFGPPAVHPDLGTLVERRYAMFTSANACQAVRRALAFCEILPLIAQTQGPKEIQPLAHYLLESAAPLFTSWRRAYGILRDDDEAR